MSRVARYVRERVAFRLAILRVLPHAGRLLAPAALLQLVGGLMPVAFIVATSRVVGRVPDAVDAGLDSPEWASLRNALLLAGALFVAQQVLAPIQWTVGVMLAWRVDDALRERAAVASFGPVGVGALEDPTTFDALADLSDTRRGTGFTPGWACWATLLLLAAYVQWALATIFIGVVYAWWAAAAVGLAALALRFAIRTGFGVHSRFEGSLAPERRRRDYYRDLIMKAAAAKEIRVFSLLDWLRGRFRSHALEAILPVWRSRRRNIYGSYLIASPVWLLLSAVATVAAARAGAGGTLTLGELVYVLQAIVLIGAIGTYIEGADHETEHGLRAYTGLERLERLVAEETAAARGHEDAEGTPRERIRFEDVTFGYGGRPVLRGLDLTIEAGRSLAIVGLNGAGKTTLVKLLTRLYDPQAGRITVDGRDVRDLRVESWRRRVAAIFQDFVRYELPVRDNVGFGAVDLLRDDVRIRSALDRAGALELVDALPHGLETPLSPEFAEGSELSGGQWQRIAIARALLAVEGGASVLVLDEPTANLDVRAEAAFFERFLQLTHGLTTILISHRFSTVRRADRIVVLEDGRVTEDGTHAELLAADGRYAELFRLQAARFA